MVRVGSRRARPPDTTLRIPSCWMTIRWIRFDRWSSNCSSRDPCCRQGRCCRNCCCGSRCDLMRSRDRRSTRRPIRPWIRPTVPGASGDWRCRPSGRRRALLHSSIRARCPSGEPPCRLCWRFPAAWPCPSKQTRDLPLPRALLPGEAGSGSSSATDMPLKQLTSRNLDREIDWEKSGIFFPDQAGNGITAAIKPRNTAGN